MIQRIQSSIPNYGGNYNELPPVPITTARLGATAPTLATFIGNIQQYTFDNVNDYVIGATELTHSYKEGSNIEMHLHWATNGLDATARTVKWQLEYAIANVDTSWTYNYSGSTTIPAEQTIPANTPSKTTSIISFGYITGTTIKIGAYIVWRLSRIASTGTEPSLDPFALAIGFHVKQNSLGSRQEYIK